MKVTPMLSLMIATAALPAVAQAQGRPSADAPLPPPGPPTIIDPATPPTTATLEPQAPPLTGTVVSPDPYGRDEVVEEGWNPELFVTGVAILGTGYVAGVIGAATNSHHALNDVYIPVAGPWMALYDWGSCPGTQICSNGGQKFLLAADGIVQAAGVIAMIDSLLTPRHHHVFASTAVNDKRPHLTPSSSGIAMFSHF
jgi:hypothetical protein